VREAGGESIWTGQAELLDASMEVPGSSQRLTIQRAEMDWTPSQTRIRNLNGALGKVPVQGRWQRGSTGPATFDLSIAAVDIAE